MASDLADPYTYTGTDVLGNKHGIRNGEALKQFEYEQSATRIAELREKPIPGSFGLDHLRAIHAHIFQDCYDWAGQVRTVNLSKGTTSFARKEFIEVEAQRLGNSLAKERNLQGLEKPQFVERLAHYYAEWNALHPFREGNGRSTRELVGQLAREAGYDLDQTRIDNDKGKWNEAAKRSFQGDLGPVREVFTQAVRPSRAMAYEHMLEADALAKHPELKGAYAAERAMYDSLAKRYPDNDQARAHFGAQGRAEIMRKLDSGLVPAAPAIERETQSQPARVEGRAPDRLAVLRDVQPEPPQPARARAFQAVADNKLSRDDALKFYPELRPAFNQLVVAKLQNAGDPGQVEALRGKLQAVLNAGEIPAPARPGQQLHKQHEMQR